MALKANFIFPWHGAVHIITAWSLMVGMALRKPSSGQLAHPGQRVHHAHGHEGSSCPLPAVNSLTWHTVWTPCPSQKPAFQDGVLPRWRVTLRWRRAERGHFRWKQSAEHDKACRLGRQRGARTQRPPVHRMDHLTQEKANNAQNRNVLTGVTEENILEPKAQLSLTSRA